MQQLGRVRSPFLSSFFAHLPPHSYSSSSFTHQIDSSCTQLPINNTRTFSNTSLCTSIPWTSQPFIHTVLGQSFIAPCLLILLIQTLCKVKCLYSSTGSIKIHCWSFRSRRGELTADANTFKSNCNGKISVGIGQYHSTTTTTTTVPPFDAYCYFSYAFSVLYIILYKPASNTPGLPHHYRCACC